MTFAAAVAWTLLALFVELFLVGATEAGRTGALFDLTSRTACRVLAYSIVLFGILRVHEPDSSIRQVLALRRPSVVALVCAVAFGAALVLPLEWFDRAVAERFPLAPEEQEALSQLLSVSTLAKRISLVVALCVVQPVSEELFFRSAIFTPLSRLGRAGTVVLATAAFESLSRFSPREWFAVVVPALAFSWMRSVTESVLPSLAARVTYYTLAVMPIVLGRELHPTRSLLLLSALGFVAGLGGIFVFTRRRLH